MTEEVGVKSKPTALNTIAVLLFQFCGMGFVITTPIMLYLMQHFGETAGPIQAVLPITLISTLVTLFTVVGILLSGTLAGKVKVRTLAILGSFLFTIFGTLPVFFDNYIGMLICRSLCGLGLGLLNPLAGVIVLGCYEGSTQAKLTGYGTVVMNAAGILLQTVSGIMADAGGWQVSFWLHLFGIIPIIFSFLLPEPHNVSAEQKAADRASGEKTKIPAIVWFFGIAFFVFQMMNYPAFLNMSVIFDLRGLGAATEAGMALNMFTIFGVVAGLVAGRLLGILKHFNVPLGWLLCAIGIFLVFIGENPGVIYVGMALLGFGFDIILPAVIPWIGMVTKPSQNAHAVSIAMLLLQLGSFFGSYWLVFCGAAFGDSVFTPLFIEVWLCVALAVIFLILPSPWKKKKKGADAETPAAA